MVKINVILFILISKDLHICSWYMFQLSFIQILLYFDTSLFPHFIKNVIDVDFGLNTSWLMF